MVDFKPSCPVEHSSKSKSDSCPVDHSSLPPQSTWSRFLSSSSTVQVPPALSQDRETSSIPKATDGKWVYPSEAQFFAAMARKNHSPQAADMKTIVPIHNAVNERAWGEILKWESGRGGEACGGVKLVNFKGKPNEKSPKAKWNMLLGYLLSITLFRAHLDMDFRYAAPFDRHDWVIDRCGTRMRYIIDFYTGHSADSKEDISFYLDVRPALDNWEGIKMRLHRLWSS